MSRIENIYKITKKLLGEINPQGESNGDAEKLENLELTIDLVEGLITDIVYVARNKDAYEASVGRSGKRADKFITDLKELLLC